MLEVYGIMTLTDVKISVPSEMVAYINTNDKNIEMERNALLLYPFIKNMTISHGKAAEILGIPKWELIQLYGRLGLAYFNMDISEVEEEVSCYQRLKEGVL